MRPLMTFPFSSHCSTANSTLPAFQKKSWLSTSPKLSPPLSLSLFLPSSLVVGKCVCLLCAFARMGEEKKEEENVVVVVMVV